MFLPYERQAQVEFGKLSTGLGHFMQSCTVDDWNGHSN